MQKIINFLMFTALWLLFSCSNGVQKENEDSIFPGESPGFLEAEKTVKSRDEGYEAFPVKESPKILIQSNEQVLQILNQNLDLDQPDEQILILKMTDDVNMPIKIVVGDFDPVRDSFIRSWEYLTGSTNQRAYDIVLEDIIGDFNLELVFTGTGKKGEMTLDIFKKIPSPSNLGLFFAPISQLVSDGTIKIERHPRSTTYLHEQKPGKSFPIILEKQDRESDNNMDLIRETYEWVYTNDRYEKISQKKIPARLVEQNQLKDLFYSTDIKKFEKFLDGPWFNKNNINTMVVFKTDSQLINFYSNDIQEIYYWDYLKRTVYNGLLFITRNQNKKAIRKYINISISPTSLDTLTVSIGDISWDGTYKRVNDEFLESLYKKNVYTIEPADIQLSGFYEDDNDELQIIFEPPYFNWIAGDKERYGGYSVITNVPVLNNYYHKRKLRQLPLELTADQMNKEILGKIPSNLTKRQFKGYYSWNRQEKLWKLKADNLADRDEVIIWDILLDVGYGGYKDYLLGVVTLKFLDENNLVENIENYILEYAEIREEIKTLKSIVLTPGELGVKGIEAITDEQITLLQVEYDE